MLCNSFRAKQFSFIFILLARIMSFPIFLYWTIRRNVQREIMSSPSLVSDIIPLCMFRWFVQYKNLTMALCIRCYDTLLGFSNGKIFVYSLNFLEWNLIQMSEISLKMSEISLKTSENTATPFSEWQYFHSSHSKKFREY